MKFEDAWRVLQSQKPKLKTDKAFKITPENFRKALKWAYDRGAEEESSKQLFNRFFN